MSRPNLWRLFVALSLTLAAFAVSAQQQFPALERGFHPSKLYQFNDADSVSVFSGALLINLPIGPEYRLDGGLTYGLQLSYIGKAYDLLEHPNGVHAYPSERANAGFGWILGMGRFVARDDPANHSNEDLYEAPDGSDHLFDAGLGSAAVTSNGSNLRLRRPSATVREVDFPDGTTKSFEKNGDEWQLRQIRTKASSETVTITSGTGVPTDCTGATDSYWAINDSKGRTSTVCFANLEVDDEDQPIVDRVVFASPGGTAIYQFSYVSMTISKPGEDTDDDADTWRQTHDVQVLQTVTLPDQSTYRFTPAVTIGAGDVIGTMTLPTLAKVSYQYESWNVPSVELCSNVYGPNVGFGGHARGVLQRTLTPAVPSGQTPMSHSWSYARELRPSGFPPPSGYMSVSTCLFEPPVGGGDPRDVHVRLYDEMVVSITDPFGHRTDSHFSVWPEEDPYRTPDPGTSPAGFKGIQYAYPHGRYDASQDRYLSQEIFDCTGSCELKRSIWVRHVPHQPSAEIPRANRLESQRTVFHDDPSGCIAEGSPITCARTSSNSSDWDNYGHYRVNSSTRRFDSDTELRTVTTAWNKVNGVARSIGEGDAWLLNTYESVATTEGGVTAREQACFDLTNGFLRGRRTLLGTVPATTDLLVKYENENLNGNTSAEKFFGGDRTPIAQNQSVLCSALDSIGSATPAFRINHTWQNGYPVKSQYEGLQFFSTDLTVDLHGLVTSSRDPGGRQTSYGYDPKWRLTSVSPPGETATSYSYTNASAVGASLAQPAEVVETTGTIQRKYQFDSFGRLWRQKQLMPNGQWSLRETLYDGMNRNASVSEAASLEGVSNELTFVPPNRTIFSYDVLGRPTSTTLPDGKSTLVSYQGSRTTTRTYTIASGSPTETTVGKREETDALGRLIAVTENVDLIPGDGIEGELTTSYSYDVGSRLSGVSMPGAAGTQIRTFTYDKRGLLQSEKHPELGANGDGTASYSLYNARGQAGKKTISSAIDVRYDFDAGERLIRVKDGRNANRDLTLFSWDCVKDPNRANPDRPPSSWDTIRLDVTQPCGMPLTHPGQLAASARYNYDTELGTVAVTEVNSYNAVTGRLERRDNAIGDGIIGATTLFEGENFFFTQFHNALGLLSTATYPCRTDTQNGSCQASDPGRVVTQGYTNGALTSVSPWASTITYQPNGTIDAVTHGSGATRTIEKWEADPHGMARPLRIYSTNASGSQLWSTGNYEFDGSGNIKKMGNTSYFYDALGRLFAWTESGESGGYSTTSRGYDEFGNHTYTAYQGCGPGPTPNCYYTSVIPREMRGTTNRYLDTGYDSAGNVLLDTQQRAFTWDPLGMMTSATVDGRTFIYFYDADGERIAAVERVPNESTTRNLTTFTLRGGSNELLSTWTDNWTSGASVFTRKEDTIWRGSQVLARVDGSTTMNYALDHLGSPRLITNGSGGVLGLQNFDPFGGGGLYGSGALQFTGHERDQANLGGGTFDLPDYMHARYYSPAFGRFLSVDPEMDVRKIIHEPQQWNRYSYVVNNPMKYTDPDGKDKLMSFFFGANSQYASLDTWEVMKMAFTGQHAGDSMSEGVGEFAEDHRASTNGLSPVPTTKTEMAMVPIFMGLGGGVGRTTLAEAKNLIGKWAVDPMQKTVAASLRYHFKEHAAGVGAKNMLGYLRSASEFARNLKGAAKSVLEGGKIRYMKNGRYVILDADGKIVSYGAILQ